MDQRNHNTNAADPTTVPPLGLPYAEQEVGPVAGGKDGEGVGDGGGEENPGTEGAGQVDGDWATSAGQVDCLRCVGTWRGVGLWFSDQDCCGGFEGVDPASCEQDDLDGAAVGG